VPAIANDPPIILEIVQARGKVSTIQQPGRGNDYTLIVEFDDVIMPDKTYGDELYEINLIAKEWPSTARRGCAASYGSRSTPDCCLDQSKTPVSVTAL